MSRTPRRWPLILLALPASVAVWSGWVELGEMTGFGAVRPLPGILDGFEINSAIALPVGVEAYAAYAMSAWLSTTRAVSAGTRRFAKWSAVGSLLLGMLGQVAYHLLQTAGYTSAPWWITTIVACLPVAVLGMGAALAHMLSRDAAEVVEAAPVEVEAVEVEGMPGGDQADAGERAEALGDPQPAAAPQPVEAVPGTPAELPAGEEKPGYGGDGGDDDEETEPQVNGVPATGEGVPDIADLQFKATSVYFSDLINGDPPTVRRIKTDLSIGTDKARHLRAYLADLVTR